MNELKVSGADMQFKKEIYRVNLINSTAKAL